MVDFLYRHCIENFRGYCREWGEGGREGRRGVSKKEGERERGRGGKGEKGREKEKGRGGEEERERKGERRRKGEREREREGRRVGRAVQIKFQHSQTIALATGGPSILPLESAISIIRRSFFVHTVNKEGGLSIISSVTISETPIIS